MGPSRFRTSANIQAREMTGEANYKGLDFSFEKRLRDGYSYRAVVHLVGNARPGARTPCGVIWTRAKHSGSRIVGGAERLRHPTSTGRELHLRIAVRSATARTCRMAWPVTSSAVGWSAASSARDPGVPFTVTQGNNNVGADQTGLPNLTGDPQGAETVAQWFNPAAFTPVPSGTFGERGPQYPPRPRLGDV